MDPGALDEFGERSGRGLLLSLRRLGALVAGRMGLREDEYDRDMEYEGHGGDFLYERAAELMDEDLEADDGSATVASASSPAVASCSFLFPGRSFSGQQRLTTTRREQEDWAVTATIYSCDFKQGRVTGGMVAQNNPQAKRPIVTYFEGEIIDNVNHTFFTGPKWGCPSEDTDLRFWSRCPGFTSSLRGAVQRHDGRAPQLGASHYVFMRWKECFFVDVPQDCPLTIRGFYYLSLDRRTGSISGYYHDSNSELQVLQLRPLELEGSGSGGRQGADSGAARTGSAAGGELPAGMAFGSYTLF